MILQIVCNEFCENLRKNLRKSPGFFSGLIILTVFFNSQECRPQAVKGQSIRMHTIPLTKKTIETSKANKPLIGFVSLFPYNESDAVTKTAFDQLSRSTEFSAQFVTIRELEKKPKQNNRFAVLWIHRTDTTPLKSNETDEKFLKSIKGYVEQGGKLLLSMQAAHYLNALGYETEILHDSAKTCADDGYGRRLGFHAFREHPLFTGLNGGAYIQKPLDDVKTRITGYFGTKCPANGKVVAVDWDYIFLREDSKLILEHTPGSGKILTVGAYMDFAMPNRNAAHLDMFTTNCFKYLTGQFDGKPEHYWDYSPRTVKECAPRPESDRLLIAVPPSVDWNIKETNLTLKRRFATENFWDAAGERMLTMGNEKGGIEEVWAHPFMAFRDYEVGIRFNYRDTIYWLGDEKPEISVNPSSFSRLYKFQRAYLKEVVVNHPFDPSGVIHYEYRGVYPAELVIRFKSNLRWMWPYSDRVTGSICHSWNTDIEALAISDYSGDLNVIIGGTKKPDFHLAGQFDGFNCIGKASDFKGVVTDKIQISGLMVYSLQMNDNFDIVYSASSEGFDSALISFDKAIHNPQEIYTADLKHSSELLSESLLITTPDTIFNTGYRWALLAADRFFVNTPGMGKALVAGYSTTSRGWDGGHAINGRPGYGWYFGRDAEWSSFAAIDYGDFGKVRQQLEFFNKYQDLNGKIFHEASTSGLIHYDAADATPLYIVLAGRYFRHTNDTAFMRKTWPNVKRAINFCFSTDTDQDHLIENTNVGHGWVEGGNLFGSHATIYMAGSWGAALREAANMARFMKDIEEESYRMESDEQMKIIDTKFWDASQRFFSYGMDKDKTFRKVQTILPAVPIYFRMTDREKGSVCAREYAGNAFTTNWGARILREDNPWFKPAGYHYGSVWPLFTGWASLAEYTTGNAIQGFSHIMNNLNVYRNWGLGFVEEVLNGAEYEPSGVCPHQCWSETMVLQPAIEGMLGLEVRAQENKIILSPNLPANWDSLKVQHIGIANRFVDFHFVRKAKICEYTFTLNEGKPVTVEFMPYFPAMTKFAKVTLNGKDIPFTTFKTMQAMCLIVAIELASNSKLTIETEGGINVIPIISNPKPGDPAGGMRIISTKSTGELYITEVEGLSGSSDTLEFWSGNDVTRKVNGATLLDQQGRVSKYRVDFKPSESKYSVQTVTLTAR
ncbi:MAG: GH116 family glycosyl hydrolase [Bacteroidetes bacterium]|nr:GH116 family glycosyl hydrolase [Bacteroidota bacterium]